MEVSGPELQQQRTGDPDNDGARRTRPFESVKAVLSREADGFNCVHRQRHHVYWRMSHDERKELSGNVKGKMTRNNWKVGQDRLFRGLRSLGDWYTLSCSRCEINGSNGNRVIKRQRRIL